MGVSGPKPKPYDRDYAWYGNHSMAGGPTAAALHTCETRDQMTECPVCEVPMSAHGPVCVEMVFYD